MPTELESTDRKAETPVLVPPPEDAEGLRKLALERINAKRRFFRSAVGTAALIALLTVVWAVSEYSNAGGWPTDGFSQSSGTPHVWNVWIVYPVIVLSFLLGMSAWRTFSAKPITEEEIKREIERLNGRD